MMPIRSVALVCASLLASTLVLAKLPPVSDEAKAKAAEATAKTAHGDKVAAFKLCQSMERVAAKYAAEAKKAGREMKPTETPACTDPGPFVYTPAAATTTPAGNTPPGNAAAPAAPAAPAASAVKS